MITSVERLGYFSVLGRIDWRIRRRGTRNKQLLVDFFPPIPPVCLVHGGGGIVLRSRMSKHVAAIGSESMLDASIPVYWARFSTKWVKGGPSLFLLSHGGGGRLLVKGRVFQ